MKIAGFSWPLQPFAGRFPLHQEELPQRQRSAYTQEHWGRFLLLGSGRTSRNLVKGVDTSAWYLLQWSKHLPQDLYSLEKRSRNSMKCGWVHKSSLGTGQVLRQVEIWAWSGTWILMTVIAIICHLQESFPLEGFTLAIRDYLWKMWSWETSWLHSIPVFWNMLDDVPCVVEAPQGLCQHCLYCDGVGREKQEWKRIQRRKQNWVGLTSWVFKIRQGHNIAWPFMNLNVF